MITVACVWTGNKYGVEYVERLRNMVARHLPLDHRFVCITDRPNEVPHGVLPIYTELPGWWAKMEVFNPDSRMGNHTVFFDLDTVIVDDLTSLVELNCVFGICENFTKRAGHKTWSCNYGSCVMSLAPGWGRHVYNAFMRNPNTWMDQCPRGDQQAIEEIQPGATYLQYVLPDGYFLGYRDMTESKPKGCAIVIFAGSNKPHNCAHQWIKDAWK